MLLEKQASKMIRKMVTGRCITKKARCIYILNTKTERKKLSQLGMSNKAWWLDKSI